MDRGAGLPHAGEDTRLQATEWYRERAISTEEALLALVGPGESAPDLCHYDSDKSYVGRMWAYGLLWEALEPGGFFVSDDIGDNDAFRVFAGSVAAEPIVVEPGSYDTGAKYVGVLRKK